MQHGRPNAGRAATGMGIHGVVPPGPATPLAHGMIPAEVIQGDANAERPAAGPHPAETGLIRGLMQNQSDGWPIPRRRFEFSVILVGELGAVLLIAPVYLIFIRFQALKRSSFIKGLLDVRQAGHAIGLRHSAGFHAITSYSSHMLQFTELVLGFMAMLLIPILSKRLRGSLMLAAGLVIILNLIIFLSHQKSILTLLIAYPLVSLLALVMLDAVTGIRPAALQSSRLAGWQLIFGSAVAALWSIPLMISFSCKVFPSLFSQSHLVLTRAVLMAATLGATISGICALHGYFRSFSRRINLFGRLTGSLALAVAMGLGLWGTMVGTGLIKHQDKWLRLEMLWMFLLVSGAYMLCWGGMTQRMINLAARDRCNSSDDSATGAGGMADGT